MGQGEQYIANIAFRNHIYTYTGQQFEDFFVSIMTKSNSSFYPVKAYGKTGDEKNDGFDRINGIYYQIFAPEDLQKNQTIYEAVKKLKLDFKGLYEHWNNVVPIKEYNFVINDKYKGVPSLIHKTIIELNKEYSDVSINLMTAQDLERIFNQLDWNSKHDIIGFIPDEIFPVVEYDALNETVSHLMKVELGINSPDSFIVPDFDEKIIFNGLSDIVKSELVTGSYQENLLTQYFNENPGIREVLQKKFNGLYLQAKKEISDSQEHAADCRFYFILEKACPKNTMPIH